MEPAFEVSWHAIEPHWKVVDRRGEELGEVYAVVGDRDEDIFDGLAITKRGGPAVLHAVVDKPRYVGFEQVTGIEPGLVRLNIDESQVDDLPEHQVADTLRILPDGGGTGRRAQTGGEDERPGPDRDVPGDREA